MEVFASDDALSRLALAFALSAATAGLCWLAASRRLLLNGVTARSNHKRPTSRAGGAVILAVFSAAVLGAALTGDPLDRQSLALFGAVALAGGIGLLDDLTGLPALLKLGGMVLVAALVAGAAGPIEALPVPGIGWMKLPGTAGFLLAALWVLGFVNVFNFLDGLNGMAAGTGLVLLASLAVLGGAGPFFLSLVMAGALLGFAGPNVLSGRPFLGDAGSLSVGALIAGGALAADGGAVWLIAGGAIAFLADAAVTIWQRARAGEAIMQAHSVHAYQRLHRGGWSHQAVSLAYAVIALAAVAAGLIAGPQNAYAPWASVAVGLGMWVAVTRAMFRIKTRERY